MSIEAMKLALEALGKVKDMAWSEDTAEGRKTIEALRAAIEQAEKQEPVAYWDEKAEVFCMPPKDGSRPFAKSWKPLYTAPPQQRSEQWWKHEISNAFAEGYEKGRAQREWQGLTEDDALQLLPVMPYEYEVDVEMILEFASAIEQALKENNNAI
jgi:hypothetical protein